MNDRIAEQTTLCTYCPKMCRVACPIAEATAREELTPWSLMLLLGQMREGRLALDAELAKLFYQCSGCGRCKSFCAHGNEVPAALFAGRAAAAAAGLVPKPLLDAVDRLRHTGNSKGENLAARQRELFGERVGFSARTLFFPGCEALSSGGEAAVDAVRLLEHAGFGPLSLLDDAPSSGEPYDSAGLEGELRAYAERLAERLSRYALVVSGCPSVVYMLRVRYPALGVALRARVVHVSELVTERINPAAKPSGLRVAFHDCDDLGRGLGVYEPPRELLRKSGAEVLEFFDRRAFSRPSGHGFGHERLDPATAHAIAARRVEGLPADADVLATACPACAAQLRAVSPKPVEDVATLCARTLGLRT